MAACVFGSSLLLLLLRWLVPGPVGAADNGDGWRLLCHIGANQLDRYSEDWVMLAYEPAPECASGYVSSQTWLQQAAQWVGHRLGSSAGLDLYVLGALSCVLAAGAITLLAASLPLSTPLRLLAAGAGLLVLTDSAFFGWFVSVLSEGSAFLGITLLAGGLLALQRADRWRFAGAALTCAGAVIAVNAKAQTLLLLPLVALALVLARRTGGSALARWSLPVGILAVATTFTVSFQQSGNPAGQEYEQINAYHSVFNSIVRPDHAAADLAEFGLPPSFAQYQGTSWWGERPAAHTDPLWGEYQDRINRDAVLRYYAAHPIRTVEILHDGAKDMLSARPENIGSYPQSSGEPAMAQEFRVPLLSGATRLVAPLGMMALLPLWALTAAAVASSWRRERPLSVVVGFLLFAAVSQHAVAALGEGIEGVKHQVVALFCTLLAALLAAVLRWATRTSVATGERSAVADELDVVAPEALAGSTPSRGSS